MRWATDQATPASPLPSRKTSSPRRTSVSARRISPSRSDASERITLCQATVMRLPRFVAVAIFSS